MNNILNIKTPSENEAQAVKSDYGIDNHGITNIRKAYWNLPSEALYEEIAFRGEGKISQLGPLVVNTGKKTSGGESITGPSAWKNSTILSIGCRDSCRGRMSLCRIALQEPIRSTA